MNINIIDSFFSVKWYDIFFYQWNLIYSSKLCIIIKVYDQERNLCYLWKRPKCYLYIIRDQIIIKSMFIYPKEEQNIFICPKVKSSLQSSSHMKPRLLVQRKSFHRPSLPIARQFWSDLPSYEEPQFSHSQLQLPVTHSHVPSSRASDPPSHFPPSRNEFLKILLKCIYSKTNITVFSTYCQYAYVLPWI